jgi:hypothetical protein
MRRRRKVCFWCGTKSNESESGRMFSGTPENFDSLGNTLGREYKRRNSWTENTGYSVCEAEVYSRTGEDQRIGSESSP